MQFLSCASRVFYSEKISLWSLEQDEAGAGGWSGVRFLRGEFPDGGEAPVLPGQRWRPLGA